MAVVRLSGRVYGVCVGRPRSKTEVVRERPTAKPKNNEVEVWLFLWVGWIGGEDCTRVEMLMRMTEVKRKVSEGEWREAKTI